MDERPTPPLADQDAYGASEISEDAPPLADAVKGFNAVAEFTVPVELDQMANGAGTEIPKPKLAPIPFKQIQLGTSAVYLVKNLIPREGLVVVWGPPKCGKSFWIFYLVMHIVLGWIYRGRKVKQGAVVYVACEGQQGFRARIEAFRQRYLSEEPADVPFYLVPASLNLIAECEDLVAAIRAELGTTEPVVVVLDTLNRSIEGDENSSEDMTAYIRAAGVIQEAFGCAVIVVHHCGVEGKRPRGHTSLEGAVDVQIAVKRDDAGTITAKVERAKDGPEGDEICSRLEAMEVGVDEDGTPITSCVIVPADKEAGTPQRKVSGQAKVALDLLGRAIVDAGEIPPASNHIPGQIHVVPLTLWRQYCYEGLIGDRDNRDTIRQAFNRNSKKLQELGVVGTWQDWVWTTGQAGHGGTT